MYLGANQRLAGGRSQRITRSASPARRPFSAGPGWLGRNCGREGREYTQPPTAKVLASHRRTTPEPPGAKHALPEWLADWLQTTHIAASRRVMDYHSTGYPVRHTVSLLAPPPSKRGGKMCTGGACGSMQVPAAHASAGMHGPACVHHPGIRYCQELFGCFGCV